MTLDDTGSYTDNPPSPPPPGGLLPTSPAVPQVTKDSLRRDALARRAVAANRDEANRARTALLLRELAGCHTVACYASLPDEPDTWPAIDAWHAGGARVLLPVLRRAPDWAWYAGREALRPSPWRGIAEPDTPRLGATALAAAEAIVLSGLAGCESGARLGTGGGWYDRALAWASPTAVTILLLDEADLVPYVPTDPWDRPVTMILTERRRIDCAASPPTDDNADQGGQMTFPHGNVMKSNHTR